MNRYNKAFASVVGGIVGSLVAFGLLPDEAVSAELQAAIVVLMSTVATLVSPKNSG